MVFRFERFDFRFLFFAKKVGKKKVYVEMRYCGESNFANSNSLCSQKHVFLSTFFSLLEAERAHFASKNIAIKNLGLGFRLEEKVVLIGIWFVSMV